MSQLKYIITADDSDFKKKIAEVAKLASQSGGKMVADVNKVVEAEVRKRKDVTKVIEEQTAAIQKRNAEDAKAPIRKPVPFEIVKGNEGVISSGTVVSPKDIERAANANQAYAASTQLAQAGLEKQAVSTAKVSTNSIKQIGILESMKDKLNDLKRAQDTASDPIKIQSYNKEIQKTEAEIKRMSNVGKAGFDNMGNAIQKSTNMMGKAWSSLRMIANILPGVGIAGLIAFALDPIIKWVASIGQATEATKAMNAVRQTSASTIAKEVAETELLIDKINNNNLSETQRQSLLNELIAKNPSVLSALNLQNIATLEGKNAIDDYIVSLKEKIRLQALEQGYTNAVQKAADARSGALSEETDLKWYNKTARTIGDIALFKSQEETQAYFKKANEERREESAKTYDVIAENLLKEIELEVKSAKEVKEVRDTSLKALESQLAATNEKLRSAQAGANTETLKAEKKQLEAQIAQRENLLGLGKTQKASTVSTSTTNAAEGIYKQLDSLKQEYTRKAMTQDEAELQSARDKFANLAAEVAKFNADPRNKVKVSTDEIDELRDTIITDLQAKQQEARDKIEQEKKEKSLEEALKLAETHEQKVTAVQKKYADARKEIGDDISKEQSAVLEAGLQKETDALNQALIEQLDSYQAFFNNLGELSGDKLNTAATALNDDLDDLVAKYPDAKKLVDLLRKNIVGAKTASTAADFRDMADSLSFMADAMQDFGGGLSDAFRTASDLAGQVSNIKNDIAAFSKAKADGNIFGQISSGLGIIGAGFNITSALNSFLDRTTAADEQRLHNAELQLQATEGLTKALERQLKIANEAYGTDKIKEYTKAIADSEKVIDQSGKALQGRFVFTGDAEIDKLIDKVNKGEKLKKFKLWGDSQREVWRAVRDGVSQVTTNIDELQDLLDNGKLDSQTAQIAQNFIDAHNAAKDAAKAITELNTGVSFENLADDLFDAASSGIEAVGESFEATMKKAILTSLKTGAYAKQMEQFYKDFDKASEGGFTESEIDRLRKGYEEIARGRIEDIENLEKVTGIDLRGDGKEQGKGLTGIISKSITEETANKWMGVQLNIHTINKNMLTEMQGQSTMMKQYSNYALQNLNAALNIERNTANTVLRLDTAITHLTTIANNTKQGKTVRDLG